MEQTQAHILKTKLCLVKAQSDSLLQLLYSFISKEAEEVANLEELDFKRTADINFKLDKILSFLMAKCAETETLTEGLANDSTHQLQHIATSSSLPESQTIQQPEVSSETDNAKLAYRTQALEMAMSTCISNIENKTAQLQMVKQEQDNQIATIGETLDCLVSFKLDSLDAKLQQMIVNCSDKLQQQVLNISIIEDHVQEMQKNCSFVQSLMQTSAELISRLYTLENTTDQLVRSHGVFQKYVNDKQSSFSQQESPLTVNVKLSSSDS